MKITKFHLSKRACDTVTLYNTANTKFAEISADAYEKYFVKNDFSDLDEVGKELLSLGFILPDEFDEDEAQLLIRKGDGKEYEDNNSLWILPTTFCNANCFYCYEKDAKDKHTMDYETADKAVEHILRTRNKEKPLFIEWYGGEPLVAHNIITYICQRLLDEGVHITGRMVSNLGAMDKGLALTARRVWNLERINTTIDAIGEKYDEIKRFRDGKPHFDRLIDNIGYLLAQKITVEVRVAFDPMDISRSLEICDFIYNRFGEDENLIMYCVPIVDENVRSVYDKFEELEEHPYLTLMKHMWKYGYMRERFQFFLEPKSINYYCPNPVDYVIDPHGDIYRYPRHTSKGKELSIGNVVDGITAPKGTYGRNYTGLSPDKFIKGDMCKNCPILPSCQREWKADTVKCLKILPIKDDAMYLFVQSEKKRLAKADGKTE